MRRHLLAVGLLAFCLPAFATGNHEPKPKPPHTVHPHAQAGAQAGAAALSSSKATSTSVSGASAATGPVSAAGGHSAATSDNAVNVNAGTGSSHTDGDNLYVLPSPMFAPQLPAINSPCTNTSQEGMSIGFSAFSGYRGGSNTDNCVAIEMYNAAVKSCRYATAGQIMDLLTVRVLAGFQPPKRAELLDLTPSECELLKQPPKPAPVALSLILPEPPKPAPVVQPEPPAKAQLVAAPVVKPKAKPKAKPAALVPLDDCALADAKVASCKAKPKT